MAINSVNGNTLLESGFFPPVRAATTGSSIALSGLQTIDGVVLIAGDRVLVKDQTDKTTNGIYAAGTGNWVRTSDASGNMQFFSGMAVVVALGTTNGGEIFLCTCTDDPVVVGTSLITFSSLSVVIAAGISINAGTANQLAYYASSGKVLSGLASANNGVLITSSGGVPSISSTLPSAVQGNITAVGTIASGTWQGTVVGATYGGTGVNNGSSTITLAGSLTIATNGGTIAFGLASKTLTIDNTLEFAGTDSTKFTFPGSSDTVVTLAATQTLTNKTMTTPVIASIVNTGTLTLPSSTDTLVGRATTDTLTNKTFDTAGTGNVFKINGTQVSAVAGTGQAALATYLGHIRIALASVNFNSTNTDNAVTVTLPTGISRYAIQGVYLNNASASISTATVGVFTATGGGGQTIAANQSITVTASATDTLNNMMALTLTNANTMAYNDATLQVRIGTPEGGVATADVIIVIIPLT